MKHIPNIITCLSLFSGCLAEVMAINNNFLGALVFIFFAAVFDFLDGFAARMLKYFSSIGKDLDSLSDMISFGMAPGLIVYAFLKDIASHTQTAYGVPFLAFLIPVFSALRLAKFNTDPRQKTSFIGLPVPANALFWSSLILYVKNTVDIYGNGLFISIVTIVLVLASSFLLIAEIPMFSLKFKTFVWKGNEIRYIFLTLCLLSIISLKTFGISLSVLIYIFMSVADRRTKTEE